jgi:hypothetical protein
LHLETHILFKTEEQNVAMIAGNLLQSAIYYLLHARCTISTEQEGQPKPERTRQEWETMQLPNVMQAKKQRWGQFLTSG